MSYTICFAFYTYDILYIIGHKYSPHSGCLGRNTGCIIEARLFLFDLTQLGGNKLDEKALGKIEGLLLDCLECLLQIGDQVVGILGTDGQADGVLVDLLLGQLGIGQLAVGGGGRVDDKALHIRHVGQQRENLQVVDEGKGLLAAALDVKGKDGCAAVGEILLVQGMIRVCLLYTSPSPRDCS